MHVNVKYYRNNIINKITRMHLTIFINRLRILLHMFKNMWNNYVFEKEINVSAVYEVCLNMNARK